MRAPAFRLKQSVSSLTDDGACPSCGRRVDLVPDVEQGTVAGWLITYNPDDGRFYLHGTDEEKETGISERTYNRLDNAVYYARTHPRAEDAPVQNPRS